MRKVLLPILAIGLILGCEDKSEPKPRQKIKIVVKEVIKEIPASKMNTFYKGTTGEVEELLLGDPRSRAQNGPIWRTPIRLSTGETISGTFCHPITANTQYCISVPEDMLGGCFFVIPCDRKNL